MINSFGTEADGEADGSGGSGSGRKRTEAVRAVRLFGCSGCSAVRAVRAAALLPRMASGERQRSPTEAGDSSSRIQQLSFSCAVVFLRLLPSAAAARALLPRMASGERQRSPHRSRRQQQDPAAYFFSCAVVFAAVAFGNSGWKPSHRRREKPRCTG